MIYNLYVNSSDRISGAVNLATYNVNWDTFLPQNPHLANKEQMYELSVTFCGEYSILLNETAIVSIDFGSSSLSHSTASSGQSSIVAFLYGIYGSGPEATSIAQLSCKIGDNPVKVIRRPGSNNFVVTIRDGGVAYDKLLEDNDPQDPAYINHYRMILSFKAI
jgi:hypothetical protein